jgi:dipeptidyl aminopeptidase/acylaminoacyl peptidase
MTRALAALLAGLAFPALAQPLPADVAQALRPYDEFRPHVLWSWHPDGREMVVGRRSGANEEVHRVEAPGAAPQPLGAGGKALAAAYQPTHGNYLVFIAEGAEGSRRLQRYDVASASASPLSPGDEQAMEFTWNPSGDRIAYATVSEDPRSPARTHTTLRIVDPKRPATERRLARLDGRWKDLRFSADGRRLALTQEVSTRDSRIWVMEVANAKRRRVTRLDARSPATWRSPAFSRDGRALFALSDRASDFRRLVLVPIGGGAERVLTSHLRFDVDDYALSYEAGLLAFVTNENGAHVMRFIDLATLKEQPRPPLLDGVIGGLAWRPKAREIGFHITSARSAGDVVSYDAKTNQLTRWTNGNSPGVNTREFAEPRLVRWKSFDGREVTGLLYAPPARFPGKRPVIVDHRAGPGSQWRAGFLGRANYVVGELGVAILRPNVRGSAGFGKSFLELGAGARRDDARKDIASLLEWIGQQPGLDESRTLVVGSGVSRQPDDDGFLHAAIDFARRVAP